MSEETKQVLQLALSILKDICIEQHVSIAVDKETGNMNFFDTDTYLKSKEFSRIKVSIQDLVK